MYVNFETAALFSSLYRRVKRAAISKQTYIWTPQSCSYFVLALGSRFCVNEISKFRALQRPNPNCHEGKKITDMYVHSEDLIPKTLHVVFGQKNLCCKRAAAKNVILYLLTTSTQTCILDFSSKMNKFLLKIIIVKNKLYQGQDVIQTNCDLLKIKLDKWDLQPHRKSQWKMMAIKIFGQRQFTQRTNQEPTLMEFVL